MHTGERKPGPGQSLAVALSLLRRLRQRTGHTGFSRMPRLAPLAVVAVATLVGLLGVSPALAVTTATETRVWAVPNPATTTADLTFYVTVGDPLEGGRSTGRLSCSLGGGHITGELPRAHASGHLSGLLHH
ncbi:MAG: hypothetical protein EXR58_04120 [Chloroflexi bacterium]|nr:hypothetical protein [Chloroflexota bacterium]